jgi:hypothetical protein
VVHVHKGPLKVALVLPPLQGHFLRDVVEKLVLGVQRKRVLSRPYL